MQEKDVEEILILMTEKMLIMEQELKVLNEKQNKEGNRGVQDTRTDDSSKQIPIAGL